ncbi:hypothetical protein B296_00050814 [Ensete ventricosum]|uniref:Uncharacterized protein n=1 Tax=Ensete ventricosum TaxID=4639 RepID=A0A426XZL1_ENSVE|nr:hypothetical protein B296_00050814 [Ensete ventricosum]
MTNADLAVTSSYPRTAGPPTWPTRHGQPVECKYEGRQWSYSRPDAGKVDTPSCKRTPHHKDGERGGRVRRHANMYDASHCPTLASTNPTSNTTISFVINTSIAIIFDAHRDSPTQHGASISGLRKAYGTIG